MNWIQINENLLRRLRPEARYLVGVSGGRDSVVLLHWLVDLGYKKLVVCHLNHQLRGRSSDADARFVQKLASKYDVDLEIGLRNVGAIAAKKKLSLETAAREARYRFFAQVAKRRRCRTIFLVHHADDLVETFLMNLFRGAGITGLSAMREIATRRVEDVDLTIARPLLGVWRGDIDAYVGKNNRAQHSSKHLACGHDRGGRRKVDRIAGKTFRRARCRSFGRKTSSLADGSSTSRNHEMVARAPRRRCRFRSN